MEPVEKPRGVDTALRWWIETREEHFETWGSVSLRGIESADRILASDWRDAHLDFLVPAGLTRCLAKVKMSYPSALPEGISVLIEWGGILDSQEVVKEMKLDNLWPEQWPDESSKIAMDSVVIAMQKPFVSDRIDLFEELGRLPLADAVELLYSECQEGPPFEYLPLEVRGVRILGATEALWGEEESEVESQISGVFLPEAIKSISRSPNGTLDIAMSEPEVVDADYAEPISKSGLAELFGVTGKTIARRIKAGELRQLPGTSPDAQKVRIHGDDFPEGLRRTHERKQKLHSRFAGETGQ